MEVMCQIQREEKEESILYKESPKIYNICGKCGLWECIVYLFHLITENMNSYPSHTMSKVLFFGLVLPDTVARSSGSPTAPYTRPRGTQPHTFLSFVVPVSFHLLLPERQGRVCPQCPKAEEQKQPREPSSDARKAFSTSAFLVERCQDRKTRQGHQGTLGIWIYHQVQACGDSFSATSKQRRIRHNCPEKACHTHCMLASQSRWLPAYTASILALKLNGSRGIINGKHSTSCCFCGATCLRGRDHHG